MEDLVKTLVTAPINGVLVLAGLLFLAVGIFGRITERLDPGPKGRIAAGASGVVLLAIGLALSIEASRTRSGGTAAAPPVPVSGGTATTASASAQPSPPAAATGTPMAGGPPPANTAGPLPAGGYPITLPAGQQTKRADRTYTILKLQLDDVDPKQPLVLEVTVRLLNEGEGSWGWGNDGIRLLIGGVPYAPLSFWSTSLARQAAHEHVFKFNVPRDATTLALQFERYGASAPSVPIR